jgi:Tfp pilus assembly protein PilN
MGGKIEKSRAPRRGAFYRPAATGWEKWVEGEGGVWSAAGAAPELPELSPMAGSLIAVPVRRAFSLAVWVPADDASLFDDLVFTQLELRGLAGRGREATAFAWQEVAREGGEALLHAVVLPAHLAPRYWHGEVTEYAVSPSCLPLLNNGVTVWREEGAWVAAVTRGEKLLHFQPLNEPEPGAAMALEISMMLAPLEAGHMTEGVASILLYHEGDASPDLADWRSGGGPEIKARPWPPPVRPAKGLDCLPLPVRDAQTAKAASARRQRWALAAAAVYFLLVLGLAANTLRLHWQAGSLQAEIDRDADDVASTKEAMQRWNALNAALDPAGYPLEVLYQVARLLPEEGVRLTLFEMNLGRVLVQGEAKDFTAAQLYMDAVRKTPALSAYEWTAENPRSLPNGSARFQIDGARLGVNAEQAEGGVDEGADG